VGLQNFDTELVHACGKLYSAKSNFLVPTVVGGHSCFGISHFNFDVIDIELEVLTESFRLVAVKLEENVDYAVGFGLQSYSELGAARECILAGAVAILGLVMVGDKAHTAAEVGALYRFRTVECFGVFYKIPVGVYSRIY